MPNKSVEMRDAALTKRNNELKWLRRRVFELQTQNARLEEELQKISYYVEPHATGAIGRWLTASEIIKELAHRFSEYDKEVEELESRLTIHAPDRTKAHTFPCDNPDCEICKTLANPD